MAISISPISTPTPYSPKDEALLNKSSIETSFDPSVNYIEYIITDTFNSFVLVDYQYNQYSFPTNGTVTSNNISSIDLDPTSDIRSKNLNTGEYVVYYNFYQNELLTDFSNKGLFIKDISSDRTELVVKYNSPYVDPTLTVSNFNSTRANNFYFQDFYLNFGDNNLVVANNITVNSEAKEILINLYDALPSNIDVNDSFWVVTKIADPLGFNISITPDPYIPTITSVDIKGPNFNLPIKDQTNNTTGYLDYTSLLQIQSVSSSNQIKSLLAEKGIDINIDYTDFNNFVHFSSIYQRITNFYYKVSQIESLNNQIDSLVSVGNSTITTNILKTQVTNIIENFDDYEYYLYYSSGSWAWPKSTSTLPYTLYSTGSTEVIDWLGSANNSTGILGSASLYDENNQNSLYYSIPEYIRDDERNEPYYLFIEMVGQYYDNIWTYYKDVTNLYVADNRLDYGISKDLVAEALKSFGLKIYQNNYTTNDLYSAFLGYTTNNSETTGSLPVTANSFQEYINNYITASYDASVTPLDDYNKEIYKRLYHNLPYLSKTKGTIPGLRALINCFGIPDTILRISEFGGRDKDTSTYDYFDNKFNYKALINDGNYGQTSWVLNSNWNSTNNRPESIQFRFQTAGISGSVEDGNVYPWQSQSLFFIGGGALESIITLQYTGSGYISASYSGSTYSSSYQYANLTFYPDTLNPTSTASIYLPFYDGGWWSVMLNKSGDTFTLYAGNKLYYDGYDGNQIGFLASSSITQANNGWEDGNDIYVSFPNTFNGTAYSSLNGYFQEIRYWSKTGSVEAFKDFVMNPSSIDYDGGENSYADYLAFRYPLGNELYSYDSLFQLNNTASIHPKITGSWAITQSFSSDSSFTSSEKITVYPNVESFFYDQPIAGIKNRVTDKIQIVSSSYPTGSVLSQYRSIEQTYPTLGSETPDINLLEVAFSPQNEINDDIISSLGYFNIGEYIGDPRQVSSSATTYPDLVNLSNNFFQKYFDSYDLFDYIRLIKYFDNSLFKMLQDFVPARTSLASGVVIKQHLLERNKYPQPQVEWEFEDYSGSVYSQQIWDERITGSYIETSIIEKTLGSTGGTFDSYNFTGSVIPPTFINNTQSWGEEVKTPVGLLTISHSTQDEFYNGELPNSIIIITDGELNEANTDKYPSSNAQTYIPTLYTSNITIETDFTNFNTSPNPGEIYLWFFSNIKTSGVRYIKVNKIDSGGFDQSSYLQNLQTLTLTYPDRTPVTYNIAGVQNMGDYFMYTIGPYDLSAKVFNTSSAGNIEDYSFQATTIDLSGDYFNYYTASNFTVNSGNSLGYFNAASGLYGLNNTPNTAIKFSFTASLYSTDGQELYFALIDFNTPADDLSSLLSTPTTLTVGGPANIISGSIIFSSSLTAGIPFIENTNNLGFGFYNSTGPYTPLAVNYFRITASNITLPFNGSSSLALFSPQIPNFDYNEYNPLLDNAETDAPSVFFMDVDYSQNPVIPVNQSLILSGSADRAPVQDSNYASKAWSNIRYNGSKYNSVTFN